MAAFVDTKVLLYPISSVRDEADKSTAPPGILGREDPVLSDRALQGFYAQAAHPTRSNRISHRSASNLVESRLRFRVVGLTVPLAHQLLQTAARWRSSYWDAGIVDAARHAGCLALQT